MFRVRFMKIEDIGNLIGLCREHFYTVKMDERLHSFDENTARKTLKIYYDSDFFIVLVAESNKELVGITAWMIGPSPYDEKHIRGSEILWYISEKIKGKEKYKILRELNKVMETCLEVYGATTFHIGVNIDSPVEKYLIKNGYEKTEHIYGKKVR